MVLCGDNSRAGVGYAKADPHSNLIFALNL